MDLKYIQEALEDIQLRNRSFNEFSSSSEYPYTYAWDYVRSHWLDFGFQDLPSRSEVAERFLDLGDDLYEGAEILAWAFYEEFE